jgi:hypothetical protein
VCGTDCAVDLVESADCDKDCRVCGTDCAVDLVESADCDKDCRVCVGQTAQWIWSSLLTEIRSVGCVYSRTTGSASPSLLPPVLPCSFSQCPQTFPYLSARYNKTGYTNAEVFN